MKDRERALWMMLVESEARSPHATEETVLAHLRVNGEIRCALRDEFNLNLDTLSEAAVEKLDDLVAKHVKEESDLEAKVEEGMKLLEELKARGVPKE